MIETTEQLKELHDKIQTSSKEDIITIRKGVTLHISPNSRFPFEFFCFRSPEMTQEMSFFLYLISGKKTFMDIGAHHGIFSLVFSKVNPTGKVYAFEPSSAPFKHLALNCALNYNRQEFYPCALSEHDGRISMQGEWDHLIIQNDKRSDTAVKNIVCKKGDTFCEKHNVQPDLIKIDVEGHELKVLRGFMETITKNRPTIFLELHPERMAEEGDEMLDIVNFVDNLCAYHILSMEGKFIPRLQLDQITTGELRIVLIPGEQLKFAEGRV